MIVQEDGNRGELGAMILRTCVAPNGKFIFGLHSPSYTVENLRQTETIEALGETADGTVIDNRRNFPNGTVDVSAAEKVYEIPNPFPFRGTTYILKRWADEKALDLSMIQLPMPPRTSFTEAIEKLPSISKFSETGRKQLLVALPKSLQLALAVTSTDPEDLMPLAALSCEFLWDHANQIPVGMRYAPSSDGSMRPVIHDPVLFETLANNRYLPSVYKEVMVLRPGAQGGSEIVGEYLSDDGNSHIYEYLRGNSYIPWGHYAANMAPGSIRYRIEDLTRSDMHGLRHLYYQRIFIEMAKQLGINLPGSRRSFSVGELEDIRNRILRHLSDPGCPPMNFNQTLWGWNFGFDFTPTHYRLHASHQQIHQQYALIPTTAPAGTEMDGDRRMIPSYACGDQVRAFVQTYYRETGKRFFECYIEAVRSNERMDGNLSGEKSLIVHEDAHCIVFVPKAQTSQWELQLMTVAPLGHILDADADVRAAIDRAMLMAVKALSGLGARMITSFEISKRFDEKFEDQRLLYIFLPRLPESPGAFSEAQLRWINGHYPEDFAAACRRELGSS
jgi:hypothetical protein